MDDFSRLQPRPRGIDDLELDFLLGCIPQCQSQARDIARRAPQIGDFTIDDQLDVVARWCNLSDYEPRSRRFDPAADPGVEPRRGRPDRDNAIPADGPDQNGESEQRNEDDRRDPA